MADRDRSRSPPRGGGAGGDRGGGGGGGGEEHRLYIGNLSFQTRSDDLRGYFSDFGRVHDATVVMEREDPGLSAHVILVPIRMFVQLPLVLWMLLSGRSWLHTPLLRLLTCTVLIGIADLIGSRTFRITAFDLL